MVCANVEVVSKQVEPKTGRDKLSVESPMLLGRGKRGRMNPRGNDAAFAYDEDLQWVPQDWEQQGLQPDF
jgi:hypothetical protein